MGNAELDDHFVGCQKSPHSGYLLKLARKPVWHGPCFLKRNEKSKNKRMTAFGVGKGSKGLKTNPTCKPALFQRFDQRNTSGIWNRRQSRIIKIQRRTTPSDRCTSLGARNPSARALAEADSTVELGGACTTASQDDAKGRHQLLTAQLCGPPHTLQLSIVEIRPVVHAACSEGKKKAHLQTVFLLSRTPISQRHTKL